MREMHASRVPVIVGVGQSVERERTPAQLDPLVLMADASRAAWRDTHAAGPLRADTVYVVNCTSTRAPSPAEAVAQLLDLRPRELGYTAIGATAPQWFVARAAERIAAGDATWVLVCGAEATYTSAPLPDFGQPFRDYFNPAVDLSTRHVGDVRPPVTPLELGYGLILPIHLYGLIENDLRARRGLTLAEHRREIAAFVARSSAVAAQHPYAHRPHQLGTDEVAAIGPHNRMVSFPYAKLMCSNPTVNQAAAVIVTSWAEARAAGVPDDRLVFVRGTGAAEDAFHVTERPQLSASPSVRDAVRQATEQAGVALADIAHLDLYSCFPCAPRIVMDMVGIPASDPRPMTVTGGMPVFGGPGNNYATHAIATIVDRLRAEPAAFGLVHALSWYLSKHVVGIYSATPPAGEPPTRPTPPTYPRVAPIAEASGACTIESYVLDYDRDGAPRSATVIARDADNRRFIARVRGELAGMATDEPIGRNGTVTHASGTNWFAF